MFSVGSVRAVHMRISFIFACGKDISRNEDQKKPANEGSDDDQVLHLNVNAVALKSITLPDSAALILSLNAAMPQPIGDLNLFSAWT